MALINVDGSTDPYYRYKMHAIDVRKSKHMKSVQTEIVNTSQIMKEIYRPPDMFAKYLAKELGTRTNIKGTVCVIMGDHSHKLLMSLLNKFIHKHVLCKSCKNPQTEICTDKNGSTIDCKACGSNKTLSVKKTKSKKAPAQVKKESDVSDDDWCEDTSEDAVARRREEAFGSVKKQTYVAPEIVPHEPEIVFEEYSPLKSCIKRSESYDEFIDTI